MSAPAIKIKTTVAVLGVALVAAPVVAPFSGPGQANAAAMVDPAFDRVWSRTDKPVESRVVARTWMWGPEPFSNTYEQYMEGPSGQRLVSYFDKSRMEINNPGADRNSQWFVTNGLLVVEMMTGRIQLGNNSWLQANAAGIPVAGDVATSLNTPTYATLASVASLNGDKRAANRTGQQVREGITRSSGVGIVDNLAGFARYSVYEPTTGHNIPDVFWNFMNQRGVVYNNNRYGEDLLVDWVFAMGYPITEPYWMPIRVGTEDRWVLMQAFQRRILTYSPYNPDGWKVEMGNVGRAYYDWRYSQTAPAPAPTPRPAASISIDPSNGGANTEITVTGKNFPAFSAVQLGVEKPAANYFRNLGTAGADKDGNFSAKVRIPTDAATLGDLTITAAANAGAVRATQTFKQSYEPTISVSPRYMVVNNGNLTITGSDFPARINVQLGLVFDGGSGLDVRGNVRTNDNGGFQATINIGNRPINSMFTVYAVGDGGYKARYETKMQVITQAILQADPTTGPANTWVTLRGYNWPANQQVTVGLRGLNGGSEAYLPDLVKIDGAGNFTARIFVDNGYTNQREVRLIAIEARSGIRLEASYLIVAQPAPTPTPQPGNASVSINPNVLVAGQAATVTGSGWPAGATVNIALTSSGRQELVASAIADRAGNFATSFVLHQVWNNAGAVTVLAGVQNGPVATTTLQIGPNTGRIQESGMPMTVSQYRGPDGSYIKVSGEGWRAGKALNITVVSANGAISQRVATASVKSDGTWQAAFAMAAPWSGRTDLGVTADAVDDTQFSVRYLPLTDLSKVNPGTYNVRGANWPANTEVVAVLLVNDQEVQVLNRVVTDPNGAMNFDLSFDGPRSGEEYFVRIRTVTKPGSPVQPYIATFGF